MRKDEATSKPTSMVEFLDQVIDALRVNDAVELGRLAEQAHEIALPGDKSEQVAAFSRRRLLFSALRHTGRNLYLLRRAMGCIVNPSLANGREIYGGPQL